MINIRMQQREVHELTPKIAVLGVGGAGGNAVNNMISSELMGCEFVVCNTDAQALKGSLCETRIQLGSTVTGGLGAGAKPEVGRAAAEESLDDVMQYLEGANMAFITAGMGGGTGTGAAPVIAKACREKGILTVGVVTKPFHFEGTLRMQMAEEGIAEMQSYVDTLIVIPNQNLFRIANEKTTFAEAFKLADSVLQSGVRGVTDLMVMPGLINLDFADIRSAMLEMGKAMMGTGEAVGDGRAVEAAESAINNPLLDDVSMKGARGVIINVTGGYDMTLFEVDEACNRIRDEVDPNANIIFGSTFDEKLDGMMRVSVVATGIDAEEMSRTQFPKSTVNAMTTRQQERRFDRAQPKTEGGVDAVEKDQADGDASSQGSQGAGSAGGPSMAAPRGYMPGAHMPPRFTAPPAPRTPASVQASAAATARKMEEEPESEMFEQQELIAEELASEASVPQASYFGDTFIPPKPVEVDRSSMPGMAGRAEPVQTAQTEMNLDAGSLKASPRSRPQGETYSQTGTTSGLSLNPPVPGASAPKKRTPTLFERFTSPLRHGSDEAKSSDSRSNSFHGRTTSSPAGSNQGQGSLNIESPAQEKSTAPEDELDIPAFLRRQAN